jgi:hypothetical protein
MLFFIELELVQNVVAGVLFLTHISYSGIEFLCNWVLKCFMTISQLPQIMTEWL